MGTYLARPSTRKEREDLDTPCGLRYACASMQGWRVAQEDAHMALPNFDESRGLSMYGVFDGHCGGVVARLVAQWIPMKVQKAAAYRDGDYPRALREAFLAVDSKLDSPTGRKMVRDEAQKIRVTFVDSLKIDEECEAEGISVVEMLDELCADNPDGMGCTAIVALLEHRDCDLSQPPVHIHVANCGDSRCVLWDERGRVTNMSRDHKPRDREEFARIEAAGGWVTGDGRIEDNLNLSRALGDFAYKRTRRSHPPEQQMISGVPEVRSRVLRPADRYVLIGCDGVWETRRGSQATVEAVQKFFPAPGMQGVKLSKSLAQFLDENLARDETTGLGMDNMTALLLELPLASAWPMLEEPANAEAADVADADGAAPAEDDVSGSGNESVVGALQRRPAAAEGTDEGGGAEDVLKKPAAAEGNGKGAVLTDVAFKRPAAAKGNGKGDVLKRPAAAEGKGKGDVLKRPAAAEGEGKGDVLKRPAAVEGKGKGDVLKRPAAAEGKGKGGVLKRPAAAEGKGTGKGKGKGKGKGGQVQKTIAKRPAGRPG